MLMEETACTAGEPTQVSVSEHMGTLACLNEHVCVHVCRNRYSVVSTYAREQFKLCFGAWKREIEKNCAFCFFCVCVCVRRLWCACVKPSMSDWRQGLGWAVKQQGASTSCSVMIKSTSVLQRLSQGMMLWLKCMISYGSHRWTHTVDEGKTDDTRTNIGLSQ